jgi:hypothetical protein
MLTSLLKWFAVHQLRASRVRPGNSNCNLVPIPSWPTAFRSDGRLTQSSLYKRRIFGFAGLHPHRPGGNRRDSPASCNIFYMKWVRAGAARAAKRCGNATRFSEARTLAQDTPQRGLWKRERDRAVRAALLPEGDGKRFGRQPPPRRTPLSEWQGFEGEAQQPYQAISLSQVPGRL